MYEQAEKETCMSYRLFFSPCLLNQEENLWGL